MQRAEMKVLEMQLVQSRTAELNKLVEKKISGGDGGEALRSTNDPARVYESLLLECEKH